MILYFWDGNFFGGELLNFGGLRVLGFNATSFQEIAVLRGDDGGQPFFLVGQLFLGGDWHGQGIRLDLHDISCLTAI